VLREKKENEKRRKIIERKHGRTKIPYTVWNSMGLKRRLLKGKAKFMGKGSGDGSEMGGREILIPKIWVGGKDPPDTVTKNHIRSREI